MVWMFQPKRQIWNYGLAIALVIGATLLMLLLNPYAELTEASFLLFFGAVTVSAWHGGRGPGVVATVLSSLVANYFFIDPLFTLDLTFAGSIRMLLFILQGGLISGLVGSLRLAQRQTKESLHQLQASEGKFRRLADSNTVGVVAYDAGGMLTDANEAFLNSLGYSREDLLSGRIRWNEVASVEPQPQDQAAHEALMTQGKNGPYETLLVGKQGQPVSVVVASALIENHPDQVVSFVLDVSERKRAEQRLSVQYAVALALAEAKTVRDAIPNVLQSLGDSLGWPIVFFWQVDPQTKTLRYLEGWHTAALNASELIKKKQDITFELGEGVPGRIWQSGRAAWIDDLAEDSNFPRKQIALEAGLHSVFGFPVAIGQQTLGVIECFSYRYQEPDDNLLQLMSAIGSQIGQFLERKQTEEELQASQALFQSFMNYSPINAYIKDAAGRYLYVNRRVEKTMLRAFSEWQGKTDFDLFPQDIAEALQANDRSVLEAGQMTQLTESLPLEEGERHFLSFKFPFTDAAGRLLLAGMSIDISDRKRFEAEREHLLQQLETSLGQLEAVINSMTEGLMIADTEGHFIQFNPAALELHGYENLKQVQQHLYRFHSDFEARDLQGNSISLEDWPMARVLRGETFSHWELQVQRLDTGKRWIGSYSGTPVRNSDGEIILAILTAHDVTEQHRVQAEITRSLAAEKAARNEAEAANRVKDEFLAVLSHELRTPLNPILGWVTLLRRGTLDPQRTAVALETIERNTKLQAQLIDDLLDISRILRGKLTLNASICDLAVVISAALETVRLAADAKSITLHTELEAAGEVFVGDFNRLQQVMWNLLSNAMKFTPEGGQVMVRLNYIGETARIQVQDTGQGIAPEFLPLMFDYFRQADSSITRKFGGLGLGLAIARQIVELHGGTICAESPGEGQGATFTVTLPLHATRPNTKPLQLADTATERETEPLADIQVLVVDDEVDNLELVQFVLEQAGATVAISSSAAEALQQIEQFKPDVLVADIGMPEMDGCTLLRRIRDWAAAVPGAEGARLMPKAIALTAYAGDVEQQKILQAGFQQHLAKPIDPEMLIGAIADLRSPASHRGAQSD